MKSGYGNNLKSTNKVFFTLKVKRGQEIDPHMVVRKFDAEKNKYVIETEECTAISGMFAGIDHGKYKPNEQSKEKDKILMYLVNESTKEIYVINCAMNAHARNIMNTMLTLFGSVPGDIAMLNISVWGKEKNGVQTANLTIRHENPEIGHTEKDMVGWFYDWEFQKEKIVIKDGDYNDYYQLERHLLERWLKAKEYLNKEHPKYKMLLDSLEGQEPKPSGYTIPNKPGASTPKEDDMPDAALYKDNEPPKTETPPVDNEPAWMAQSDDEDDLPF